MYNIFPKYLIDKLINKESKYSYIRYIKPKKNNNNNNVKQQKKKTKQIPLCLHLPCSGDQTFEWRSNHFANPLATNDNIASAEEVSTAIEQQDKKIQSALKELNSVSHAGNYQEWISKNKVFLSDLKANNPIIYKDFMEKFTSVK